jgi:hypothetical protein
MARRKMRLLMAKAGLLPAISGDLMSLDGFHSGESENRYMGCLTANRVMLAMNASEWRTPRGGT